MPILSCVQIKFSAKWVKVSLPLLLILEKISNFSVQWIVFLQVHFHKYWNVSITKTKKL